MTILAFEDKHYQTLETALYLLFPEAEVHVQTDYNTAALQYLSFGEDSADIIITDMMMPRGDDLEYCGAAIMMHADEHDIPCVCLSASHHHDKEVDFGNHLLRKAGWEMVDEVDKSSPEGWIESLKFSFGGVHDYWTTRPRTGIRSAIHEWHEGLVPEQDLEARKNDG
jgi:CheY-like chemotaxis protein